MQIVICEAGSKCDRSKLFRLHSARISFASSAVVACRKAGALISRPPGNRTSSKGHRELRPYPGADSSGTVQFGLPANRPDHSICASLPARAFRMSCRVAWRALVGADSFAWRRACMFHFDCQNMAANGVPLPQIAEIAPNYSTRFARLGHDGKCLPFAFCESSECPDVA